VTQYLGITETPIADRNLELLSAIGRQIVLRYADHPQGFSASIFDASGRKVDEIRSASPSGSITWGEGHGSGVYFLRVEDGSSSSVQKLVLIR